MVSDPGLALAIASPQHAPLAWADVLTLLKVFWDLVCAHLVPRHQAGRLKQWLNYLRRRHPEAEAAYAELRTVNDPRLIDVWLAAASVIPVRSSLLSPPCPSVALRP
jgi:tRNA-dihydrouridine synthase C